MSELIKLVNKKRLLAMIVISSINFFSYAIIPVLISYYMMPPYSQAKAITFVIIFICLNTLGGIAMTLWIKVEPKLLEQTRYNVLKHYLNKFYNVKSEVLTETHTGEIQSLVEKVTSYYNNFIYDLYDGFLSLFIILTIFFYQIITKQPIFIATIIIIMFIIIVGIRIYITKKIQSIEKAMNKKTATHNAVYIDFLQNIKTVKKLKVIDFSIFHILEKENDVYPVLNKNSNLKALNELIFNLSMIGLFVFLLIYNLVTVTNNALLFSNIVFYLTIMGNIKGELRYFTRVIDNIMRLKTTLKQLSDLTNRKETMHGLIKNFKTLKMKDIVFNYGNSQDIKIPNFDLSKKDKISIVGESGQGKTTFLNLLSKSLLAHQGVYLINGRKTKKHLEISLIGQEIDLFNLTIRDNICLGQSISDQELTKLFEKIGLKKWLDDLENGFDTIIGEKGIKLSSGQKQRLNILRGILLDKDIIILDEPTSHLDEKTELKVVQLINEYCKEKTLIIVTHRPVLKQLCNAHYEFSNHTLYKIEK